MSSTDKPARLTNTPSKIASHMHGLTCQAQGQRLTVSCETKVSASERGMLLLRRDIWRDMEREALSMLPRCVCLAQACGCQERTRKGRLSSPGVR